MKALCPSHDSRLPGSGCWTSERSLSLVLCGLLVLLIGLVFGQTAGFDFVNYDDDQDVYENRLVKGELTWRGLGAVFTDGGVQSTMPLTFLSHKLVWHLLGQGAGVHHLTNVLLHAAAAVVLLLVLWRMTGDLWPSALVAAVFAVHPLRVESVAWVTERKDVLSGFLFMVTLAAYLHYTRQRFSLGRYLAVLACLVLGLAAKPMAVTLPFVLLLLDYWPLGRTNVGKLDVSARFSVPLRLILEKVPMLVVACLFCLLAVHGRTAAALAVNQQYSFGWRVGSTLISYVSYLGQFFFPQGLAPIYPRRSVLPPGQVLAAVPLLVSITAAAVWWRRQRPYLLVGWLWYVGMLVPVIGLVQFGVQTEADRFTYLPQIGLAIALAWATADACRAWPRFRRMGATAAVCAVMILAIAAWRQTTYWRDSETLWTRTLACTSQNAVAHNQFGKALANRGRIEEAVPHFQKALEIDPNHVSAHNNFGGALASCGRIEQAAAHFQKALESDPTCAEAHNGLGNVLALAGRTGDAIPCFQRALQLKPDLASAHNGLGRALSATGRTQEAERHLREALEINADYAEAHNNLGAVLMRAGRADEAVAEFQRASQLKPDSAEFHCNLGLTLRSLGQLDEAAEEFRRALQIKPDFGEAHGNLGGILYLQDKPAEAMVHFHKHMELDPNSTMARQNFALAVGHLRGPPAALARWRWWIDFYPDDAELLNDAAWQLAAGTDESLRNGKEALDLALRAAELTGEQDPNVLGTLAAAYAEAGRYSEAVQTARQAADLATRRQKPELAESIKKALVLYEAGKPYHEARESDSSLSP